MSLNGPNNLDVLTYMVLTLSLKNIIMNHVSLIQKWSQMGVAANDGRLGLGS